MFPLPIFCQVPSKYSLRHNQLNKKLYKLVSRCFLYMFPFFRRMASFVYNLCCICHRCFSPNVDVHSNGCDSNFESHFSKPTEPTEKSWGHCAMPSQYTRLDRVDVHARCRLDDSFSESPVWDDGRRGKME